MKDFEGIVPPLELCQQIPEGKFCSSLFVWERVFGEGWTQYPPIVNLRRDALYQNIITPAPTMKEIFDELKNMNVSMLDVKALNFMASGGRYLVQNAVAPEVAMLKLWLELDKKTQEV